MSVQGAALTSNDFNSIIDDMASQFKSDRRLQSYSAESQRLNKLYESLEPVSLAVGYVSDGGDSQVVDNFVGDCKANLNSESAGFHSRTSDYTKALEASHNQDEFSKMIDEMADEAKRKTAATIDHWRDQAKELCKKNPEAAHGIIFAFQSLCSLANKVFSAIIDFFGSIIRSIVNWLVNAWTSIKNFFSDVSHLISGWF